MIQLSSLLEANPMLESSAKRISSEPGHLCSLDDWIASNSVHIHQIASESDRQAINEQLLEYAEQKRHGSTKLLLTTVRNFGHWSGIDPMRQELRGRLRDDGLTLELERATLGTDSPTQSSLADMSTDRLLTLASTYAGAGFNKDALTALEQLDASEANTDAAAQIRAAASAGVDTVQWPTQVSMDWTPRPTRGVPFRQLPQTTTIHAGNQFTGWALVTDAAAAIALRDPLGRTRRGTGRTGNPA